MAIILKEQKTILSPTGLQSRKQKKLIYLVILAVLVAAGVYFLGQGNSGFLNFLSPASNIPESLADVNNGTISKLVNSLKSTELNFSILDDKKFKNLVLPGTVPPADQVGREDPFAPF